MKPDGTRVEYEYNPLGQLARKRGTLVNRDQYSVSGSEQKTKNQELDTKAASTAFFWDGLALLQRGDESYLTEGHVSGGIPVQMTTGGTSSRSSEDSKNNLRESAGSAPTSHLAPSTSHSATTSVVVSDFLGTTLGTVSGESFRPVHLTAFGEILTADNTNHTEGSPSDIHSGFGIQDSEFSAAVFYTGKHYDEDLQSYHFLYRNYSPTKGRWTAADPSGFPDGPNQWLYVNNGMMNKVDPLGLEYVGPVPIFGQTEERIWWQDYTYTYRETRTTQDVFGDVIFEFIRDQFEGEQWDRNMDTIPEILVSKVLGRINAVVNGVITAGDFYNAAQSAIGLVYQNASNSLVNGQIPAAASLTSTFMYDVIVETRLVGFRNELIGSDDVNMAYNTSSHAIAFTVDIHFRRHYQYEY